MRERARMEAAASRERGGEEREMGGGAQSRLAGWLAGRVFNSNTLYFFILVDTIRRFLPPPYSVRYFLKGTILTVFLLTHF